MHQFASDVWQTVWHIKKEPPGGEREKDRRAGAPDQEKGKKNSGRSAPGSGLPRVGLGAPDVSRSDLTGPQLDVRRLAPEAGAASLSREKIYC